MSTTQQQQGKKARDRKNKAKPRAGVKKTDQSLKSKHLVRFVLIYALLMGGFLLVSGHQGIQEYLDVNDLYSRLVVFVSLMSLKPFGIVAGSEGTVIYLQEMAMDVNFGCNGLEACLIYTVAVLAFPAAWSSKLLGILFGFLLLQGLNVLRIVGLGLSAVYFQDYFEVFHVYVAQGFMIILALILFIFWLAYATKN